MCIFEIQVTDTEAQSYGNLSSAKVRKSTEKEKVHKYEDACREQRVTS